MAGTIGKGLASAPAVPPSSQASWTPTAAMTADGWQGSSTVVSTDAAGDFLSAWSGINNKTPGCYNYIQIRIRSHTGELGPVQTLTPCGPPMFFPRVASAADGDAIVAWIDTKTSAVEARRVSPGGQLGPLLTVTPPNAQALSVSVAMSPTGLALVAWDGQPTAARFISANSALSAVLTIGSGGATAPALAFSSSGAATLAWTANGYAEAVATRITPAGLGPFTVIEGTAGGTVYGVPEITDDSNGNTYLLTRASASSGGRTTSRLLLREWSASGSLGPSVQVANPVQSGTLAIDGSLAVDGAGDAVVAWSSYLSDSASSVYGRHVSSAGNLGPVVRLGSGFAPAVVADPAGAGLVYWQSTAPPGPPGTVTSGNSGAPTTLYSRGVAVTSGAFSDLMTLSPNGETPDAAVSPTGRFAVVWEQSTIPWPVQARFSP